MVFPIARTCWLVSGPISLGAIQCRNMEHLLEQLVQLAKVLDNDYETMRHHIEQAIPRRPVASEKAALANQAVRSPGTQVR